MHNIQDLNQIKGFNTLSKDSQNFFKVAYESQNTEIKIIYIKAEQTIFLIL